MNKFNKEIILKRITDLKDKINKIPFDNIDDLELLESTVQNIYSKELYTLLGFDEIVVNPRENCTFYLNPQWPFKPRRLVIAPSCSRFFTIEEIYIGKNYQKIETKSWSCEIFEGNIHEIQKNKDLESPFRFDYCHVGQSIHINVFNLSDKAQIFKGGILGVADDLSL